LDLPPFTHPRLPTVAPPLDLHSFPTRRSSDLDIDILGLHPTETAGMVWRRCLYDPYGIYVRHSLYGWVNLLKAGRLSDAWADMEIGRHTSELQSRFELVCRLLREKENAAKIHA